MQDIILVSLIYILVFFIDYIRYDLLKTTYKYVSRETYVLFKFGAICLLVGFHMELWSFFKTHLLTEVFFLGLAFAAALITSFVMYRTNTTVCYQIGRAEKCLVPLYALTKSTEILFQQLAFLLLALTVSREIGFGIEAILVYIVILLITHIPVVLGAKREWLQTFLIGIVILSIPMYYSYITLGQFWPAVYLHALTYVFIWLALANPTDEVG